MILILLSLVVALAQDDLISTALPVPSPSAMAAPAPAAPRVRASDVAGPLEDPRPPANPYRRTPGDSLRIEPPAGSAQAKPPADDGKMRCRRTENGFICGNGGENEQQAEELLRSLMSR